MQAIHLTWSSKGFKKSIGTYLHTDGKPRPMIWWFGTDTNKSAAEEMAQFVLSAWRYLQESGVPYPKLLSLDEQLAEVFGTASPKPAPKLMHWTSDAIASVKAGLARLKASIPARVQRAERVLSRFGTSATLKPVAQAPVVGKTLYHAITAYLEHLKGKRRSDCHKDRARQILEVNLKAAAPDCMLSLIDFLWLDRLCDHFRNRPVVLLKNGKKKGKRLSAQSVCTILRYLRLFFVWLDDTSYGGWEAPRRMHKCFKTKLADLMTHEEHQKADVIESFDNDTLVKLYRATRSDQQRAVFLLGLFCGLTQREIACLEKTEFDLANSKLAHVRHKTHVRGEYWLPPELVESLRAEFRQRRADPIALRTDEGNPVVTERNGRMISDSISLMWVRLRKRAECADALPFKYLRKTLATRMTLKGGDEMGQIALAHVRQSVLGKHYTSARRYDEFHKLQRELHVELTLAGMFAPDAIAKADRQAA